MNRIPSRRWTLRTPDVTRPTILMDSKGPSESSHLHDRTMLNPGREDHQRSVAYSGDVPGSGSRNARPVCDGAEYLWAEASEGGSRIGAPAYPR